MYNVVLVSGVQSSDIYIQIYTYTYGMYAKLFQSDSWRPHGPQPDQLFCSWDSPGKNTEVGCHILLQGIFPNQELNPSLLCLLHWQTDSLPPAPPEKPLCVCVCECVCVWVCVCVCECVCVWVCVHVYVFSLIFFSLMVYHRILSKAPCSKR